MEFAEAAFEFVKRKMTFEILPMNEVKYTIERGTGSCFHLISHPIRTQGKVLAFLLT